MRRAGFAATLVAGVGLLGASLHGMTSVDRTLAVAAATPAPSAPTPELVLEKRQRDCDRWEQRRERRHDGPGRV
jgi:hypothetical protein